MKKNDIALILGVIVVIIVGVFLMKGTKAKPTYELPLTLEGEGGLQKLNYSEYQEKINNDESFVVIIERATCSHCQNFLPVAEQFASENKLPMYYIDTDEMEDDEWSQLETSNTFFKKQGENWGTPTTIVLAGSTAVDYIEGETDADSLSNLYNKYFDIENYQDSEETSE